MNKQWKIVFKFQGFEIKLLDGAEEGDCQDYIIEPALVDGRTYPTIGDAVNAIAGRD